MTDASGTAALVDSALETPHVVIDLPSATAKLGGNERRRCTRAALVDQLFTGPELAKLLLTLCYGGILATPVISYNQILPEYYLCLISVLLLVGFFALLSAIALHKTFPASAATLGLIGATCVVVVIPTITAGVLPKLGVLVWVFFLLLVIAILLVVLVHIGGKGVPETTPLEVDGKGISDAASEIGVSKEQIDPSITSIEKKLEMPPATEVKLGSEDEAQKAEFWNSAVVCTVLGANPPLKDMKGFFKRIWGRNGIDKISKLQDGIFVVRFNAYSKALKVVEGRRVEFDGKPVITKLCEPNFIDLNKDQICARPPICETCKSFGDGVADRCSKKSATAKKMWVAKTNGKGVAATKINGIQQVHNESVIKTADKGKAICVGN